MKYFILSTKKFDSVATELNEYMISVLNLNTEMNIVENDIDYVSRSVEISTEIVKQNREGIALILIDETGGLGFVSSSKVKGMITAQISDEHSSHMTREHNGAVGISLGANISNIHQLKLIIKLFSEKEFSAGRHMVRIDMLDKLG